MQSDIKKNSQNNSVMGTRIVMSDRQCRNGYSRMDAKELWEGGCFSKTSPFEPCRTSIPDWTSLQSNTNRDCLNIWGAMALNSRGEDFVVYGENTYRIIQAQYAYHLSRNNLYMNTLDGLDQAEMNKVASSVTEPWK